MTTLAPLQHLHPPLPYRRRLRPAEFSPSSLWAHPQLFPEQDENGQKQFSQQLRQHEVFRTSKYCFNSLLTQTVSFLFLIFSFFFVFVHAFNFSPPAGG